MVRADAGGDGEFKAPRLRDALGGEVGGPERLRDYDVGVGELALEDAIRPVFVRGHHEGVAQALDELAQPELARDGAEQRTGGEVEGFRRGRGLAARVAFDPRDVVPRVRSGVTVHGVVVEHAQDLHHLRTPSPTARVDADAAKLRALAQTQYATSPSAREGLVARVVVRALRRAAASNLAQHTQEGGSSSQSEPPPPEGTQPSEQSVDPGLGRLLRRGTPRILTTELYRTILRLPATAPLSGLAGRLALAIDVLPTVNEMHAFAAAPSDLRPRVLC